MIRKLKRLIPHITIAFIFSLFLAGTCPVAAQEKSSPQASVRNFESEIKNFLDEWNTAIAKADESAIRSAYISDARFQWFEEGVLTYRSAGEIVEKLAKFPKGTKIDTKLSEINVRILYNNLAYGSASYKTKIAFPKGAFEFGGVFTMLLEKNNGKWKFISGHTSTRPLQRTASVATRNG